MEKMVILPLHWEKSIPMISWTIKACMLLCTCHLYNYYFNRNKWSLSVKCTFIFLQNLLAASWITFECRNLFTIIEHAPNKCSRYDIFSTQTSTPIKFQENRNFLQKDYKIAGKWLPQIILKVLEFQSSLSC